LRFIALPLRRTASTPHDTRFARLDLGLFTKSSIQMTFYEPINPDGSAKSLFDRHPGEPRIMSGAGAAVQNILK